MIFLKWGKTVYQPILNINSGGKILSGKMTLTRGFLTVFVKISYLALVGMIF